MSSSPTCGRIRPRLVWMLALVVVLVVYLRFLDDVGIEPPKSDPRVRAWSDVRGLAQALHAYANAHDGRYPPTLDALTERDARGRRWFDYPAIPRDPWKRPYVYEPPRDGGRVPRVLSLGPDGRPDGGDDVEWIPATR